MPMFYRDFFKRSVQLGWNIPHHHITKKGLVKGVRSRMVPLEDFLLGRDSETPWVDIGQILSSEGVNAIRFIAVFDYQKPAPESDFTVYFSSSPSMDGLIKSFNRSGPGAGLNVTVDIKNKLIKSDLEWSEESLKQARSISVAGGRKPQKFPIQTVCYVNPLYHSEKVLNNEIEILSLLGFSGLSPVSIFTKRGFPHPYGEVTYWHHRRNHCVNNLDMDAVKRTITAAVENWKQTGLIKQFTRISLMDEPSSPNLDHIAACPTCKEKFVLYLKEKRLKPQDFSKESWQQICPVKEKSNAKLYYYTVCFRNKSLADFFKTGTDILRGLAPELKTTVNFSEELTYYGNLLRRGVDWFGILSTGALSYGWTEDWLTHGISAQLCGYHADFLRSACKKEKQRFGMYTIMTRPWDTQAKAATEIGHGAKSIFFYNYGPLYTGASDAQSDRYYKYSVLREFNYAVGTVEDYLETSEVPQSRIALLYSHTTDIWTMDEGHSLFGKERMYLYLILRHLGYPVDILTEDDVIDGRLKSYDCLFVIGSHLKKEIVQPLLNWTISGGLVYLAPSTGQYDQFNSPLNLLQVFGFKTEGFVFQEGPGRAEFEAPKLKTIETVQFADGKINVVCGYQRMKKTGDEKVLAQFTDGSLAFLLKKTGKGYASFCGFFPGNSYVREASIVRKTQWENLIREQKIRDSNCALFYPAEPRILMQGFLNLLWWEPPVKSSHYLVEANILKGDKGIVISVANWSGSPVNNLKISAKIEQKTSLPFSARNKIISAAQEKNILTMEIPKLETFDFIVIPYKKSL